MNSSSDPSEITNNANDQILDSSKTKEQDSFVKLAMRNMVKKGGTSLFHFMLTIFGVVGTLVGLAIVFH